MKQAVLLLALILVQTGVGHAGPIINGDFSSFDGWSGAIRNSTTDILEDVDPASDPRFSLEPGGFSRLSNELDYYEVVLFQQFELNPTAISLGFDYAWSLTAGDPTFPDLVQALLWLPDFSDFIDLFPASLDTSAPSASGAASTNVSAFAGRSVVLEFLVQDGDFDEQDWLQIGNVAVSGGTVPLPATPLLLAIGVPLLALRGRRRGLSVTQLGQR